MATILAARGRMTRDLVTPYNVGDRVMSLIHDTEKRGRVRVGEVGQITRIIIADPGDGDATCPLFRVKVRRGTVLLDASELAPAAEAEAHLWLRRQLSTLDTDEGGA